MWIQNTSRMITEKSHDKRWRISIFSRRLKKQSVLRCKKGIERRKPDSFLILSYTEDIYETDFCHGYSIRECRLKTEGERESLPRRRICCLYTIGFWDLKKLKDEGECFTEHKSKGKKEVLNCLSQDRKKGKFKREPKDLGWVERRSPCFDTIIMGKNGYRRRQ